MNVGCPRHVEVGAHGDDVLGVVPVGALTDVGLVPPNLRECVRQVGVPVVEAHVHAAEKLQEARAASVREVRHGGNRSEAEYAVRAPCLRRVEQRRRYEFQNLVPVGPPEAALASSSLVSRPFLVVLNDRTPGIDWVGMLGLGLPPLVHERAPHVRVLDANGTVYIPRCRDAPLASARLVGRKTVLEQRVVGLLHLPGDYPVFNVDFPGAAARAVDAVRAADGLVVLPTVSIELFPSPFLGIDQVLNPAHFCKPPGVSTNYAMSRLPPWAFERSRDAFAKPVERGLLLPLHPPPRDRPVATLPAIPSRSNLPVQ